jgi:hypothetical protein
MLVELSVAEQSYQAVLAVIRDGVPIVEVAHRFDVHAKRRIVGSGGMRPRVSRGSWTGPTDQRGARIRWTPGVSGRACDPLRVSRAEH